MTSTTLSRTRSYSEKDLGSGLPLVRLRFFIVGNLIGYHLLRLMVACLSSQNIRFRKVKKIFIFHVNMHSTIGISTILLLARRTSILCLLMSVVSQSRPTLIINFYRTTCMPEKLTHEDVVWGILEFQHCNYCRKLGTCARMFHLLTVRSLRENLRKIVLAKPLAC